MAGLAPALIDVLLGSVRRKAQRLFPCRAGLPVTVAHGNLATPAARPAWQRVWRRRSASDARREAERHRDGTGEGENCVAFLDCGEPHTTTSC